MKAIIVNTQVLDKIRAEGMTANEAINAVYGEDIKAIKDERPELKDMKPMDIAFMSIGINSRTSTVGDILNKAYTTQGNGADDLLFPVWQDSRVREAIEGIDLMRWAIASEPIGVDGGVTKGFTLDPYSPENKKKLKRVRIAEGADIPTTKIKGGEVTVNLYKLGAAVETTYEAVRRMRIPVFKKTMDYIARDVVRQEIDYIADTLINGSGNNDKAEVILTTAAENKITNDELTEACFKYYLKTNVPPTTIMVGSEMGLSIAGMKFKDSELDGVSNKIRLNIPQFGDMELTVLIADVEKVDGKNVAILYNNEQTIDKYVENGSMVSETQKNIINQKNFATASENVGFAIFLKGSNCLIKSA